MTQREFVEAFISEWHGKRIQRRFTTIARRRRDSDEHAAARACSRRCTVGRIHAFSVVSFARGAATSAWRREVISADAWTVASPPARRRRRAPTVAGTALRRGLQRRRYRASGGFLLFVRVKFVQRGRPGRARKKT